MKKNLLLLALTAILLNACSKKIPKPDTIVTFAVDGQNFEIRGAMESYEARLGSAFRKDSGNYRPGRKFMGLYDLTVVDKGRVWLSIKTFPINRPEVGTYRTNADNTWKKFWHSSGLEISGRLPYTERFYIHYDDDYSEFTITRIHKGMIDGTFSARLTNIQGWDKMHVNITNGVFRNVPWTD